MSAEHVPLDAILPPASVPGVAAEARLQAMVVPFDDLGWTAPVPHLGLEGQAFAGPVRRRPGQWSVIAGLVGYGPEHHERARALAGRST